MPENATTPKKLGSRYGSCDGRTAYARETTPGSWQVKVHDPKNRLSEYDGWRTVGTGWKSLDEAVAATGLV